MRGRGAAAEAGPYPAAGEPGEGSGRPALPAAAAGLPPAARRLQEGRRVAALHPPHHLQQALQAGVGGVERIGYKRKQMWMKRSLPCTYISSQMGSRAGLLTTTASGTSWLGAGAAWDFLEMASSVPSSIIRSMRVSHYVGGTALGCAPGCLQLCMGCLTKVLGILGILEKIVNFIRKRQAMKRCEF